MHVDTKILFADAAPVSSAIAGICAGSSVMTLKGEMPVAHLKVGDKIITRDSGMAILREISIKTHEFSAILVKAGSLGHTRPDRDMALAPGARVHVRDWRAEALFGAPAALVEAERLVDGEFLALQRKKPTEVYTLTFDREHILYVDGMELASDHF